MNRDDQLADLLVAWDDAIAAGRPVTPQDLCRNHPDLLQPFLDLLRAVGHIDRVFDGPPTDPQQFVERFDAGRYKPRTFHAAGGLGMVAVAEDQELKRPVALKVMQQLAALDPAARRRFLLEAEITGKLEHPGIAPVYGAGENPNGLPYYAMRFIQGKTLADHIREHHATIDPTAKRLDFARLLRCFASVCQTVAYAHARGVLHRDIKPGNIMLGPYGETLLVDWGLAKQFDLPDPTGSVPIGFKPVEVKPSGEMIGGGQTVAGQVKGSPAFMAPEQARGEWDRVGPAADIYALGATLYVLLTGQLPYTGDSTEQIIRAVKAGPPRPVLGVNSSAPKPLAAVCAKAMARTPSERYTSAQELAADVERWLADEPVSAYRDPLFTRLRRWLTRHRTLAAAAAAGLFVLTAALAVVAPILTAKNRELGKLNDDLSKANNDLTNANTKLTDAAAAARADFDEADTSVRGQVNLVFARAAAEPGKFTGLLRTDAVVRYRDYLTRFIARNRDRVEVRLEVAAAWLKLAELDTPLDPKGGATEVSAAEAERLFAGLKSERPDDREVLYGWAVAAAQLGEQLADRERVADGLKWLAASREVFERLAADPAPVGLARMFTVPGVLDNSPTFRLAHVVFVAADARRKADRLKPAAPGTAERSIERYQADLRTVLKLLTAGRPLPADAPLFSRFKVIGVRIELAELEPDLEKRVAVFKELAEELKPLADKPGATEYKALALEVKVGQANVELTVARRQRDTALLRGDTSGVVSANKAFDSGLARLESAVLSSYDVAKADVGLDDPLGMRARAVLTPLKVNVAQLRAVREMQRDDWLYVSRTLTHLKILAEKKDLPLPVAAAAMPLVGEYMLLLAPSGYKGYIEETYVAGIALLDRLLAAAPGEPALVVAKANLYAGMAAARMGMKDWPADAAGRAKMLQSARDALATSEQLLGSIPHSPADWEVVIVELQQIAVKTGLDTDPAQPVSRCEQLLAKVNDGEKGGMPAEVVEVMRTSGETMLVGALSAWAERLLDAPKPDLATAGPLAARALKLSREVLARAIKSDDPGVVTILTSVRERLKRAMPELEKLDARVNPKK